MKRYLLFAGSNCYPAGGWNDFVGSFDSVASAVVRAKQADEDGDFYGWYQVVDSQTGRVVAQ